MKLIIAVVISAWFLVSSLKYLKMTSGNSYNTKLSGMKQDLADFKNSEGHYVTKKFIIRFRC